MKVFNEVDRNLWKVKNIKTTKQEISFGESLTKRSEILKGQYQFKQNIHAIQSIIPKTTKQQPLSQQIQNNGVVKCLQTTVKTNDQQKQEIKVKVYQDNKIHKFILNVANIGQLIEKLKYQLYKIQRLSKNSNRQNQIIIGFSTFNSNHQLDYILSNSSFKISFKQIDLQPVLYIKKHKKITLNNFTLIKPLGFGGFSIVYLVRGNFNNKYYALKLIEKKFIIESDRQSMIQNERFILGELKKSKFIAELHFCFESLNYFVLAIEYCPGGQLFYQLKKVKRMTESQAKFYFLEILIGLDSMHSKDIIYRDLKPQNLLIDAQGHIKIADFGLSKPMQNNRLTYSFCGSPEYMAPEMLRNEGHDHNIDFYCLGALLYELVIGIPPYYSTDHEKIYQDILKKELFFPSYITISEQLKDLLRLLLQKQVNKRLGFQEGIQEILSHPWVGKIDRKFIQDRKLRPPFIPNLLQFNFDSSEIKISNEQFMGRIKEDLNRGNKFEHYFSDSFYYESETYQVMVSQKKHYSLDYKMKKKSSKRFLKRGESLTLLNKDLSIDR